MFMVKRQGIDDHIVDDGTWETHEQAQDRADFLKANHPDLVKDAWVIPWPVPVAVYIVWNRDLYDSEDVVLVTFDKTKADAEVEKRCGWFRNTAWIVAYEVEA